eukprot:gene9364-14524_t
MSFRGDDNDSGPIIYVFEPVMEMLLLRGDCSVLQSIDARYPGLSIRISSLGDITAGASSAQLFALVSDALDAKKESAEVMDMDQPWVVPLGRRLQPLPESVLKGVRSKWANKDSDGNVLSLARYTNTYTLWYRRDLFKLHNITYRTDSWD